MLKLSSGVLALAMVLCSAGYCPAGDADDVVQLDGQYVGSGAQTTQTPEEAKDVPHGLSGGQAVDLAALPVLEDGLGRTIAASDPDKPIRVIVFLDYQPQDVVARQVKARYEPQMQQLRQQVKALTSSYAMRRDVQAATDAENYLAVSQAMSPADTAALRSLNEQHEALSLAIKTELVAELVAEVGTYQHSVREAVEALGGTVEFGTIAGNALVVLIPAGMVEQLASLEKVARVVEDRLMEGHLNVADDATLVSWTNGLWQNGETGGIYDPAVLDSGTDLAHPALQNTTGRTNFYSWYLVAAAGALNWDDVVSEDDRNGHGTHVMGIVASYGSTAWPNHLGMAHGVEKAVTLKAGYNGTDELAHMYHTDAMWLVDRALYDTGLLRPVDTFNDDVDGINLSYGGDTSSDETDYCRFWDSVVSSYADLVVTLSAGNSGPSNTYFTSPGSAYNPITVAAVDHENTQTRDDDEISWYSTRGPTASGRRKPDIAAPGSGDSDVCPPFPCPVNHGIESCNNNWETEADFIEHMGTSMAAPMVQGVAMDLMDAGVFDELEIKALLINTAQKNEPGINFEADSDGWSVDFGWGYMNAWAAYYHRDDVRSATVTERPTAGHYRLYSGSMRDEGAGGEGRDRATLVWNRHATYNPHDYPTTYYALSDLDLHLYRETDNLYIDGDTTVLDNVQQVRVASGTGTTDVVVKVEAYSTDFPHGGTTEEFALATEENFVEVPLPDSFAGVGYSNPGEMEPNEERDFVISLRNDSAIASHGNQLDLIVPPGWTLVSGDPDPYNAGSLAGGGGDSGLVTWRLRAQPTVQDGVHFSFDHTHSSYGESWGPYNWWTAVNVRWDATPPSPNPMEFATAPYAQSTTSIQMVATTATDLHGPVEYYLDFYNSPTGGSGGTDSGYQTATGYTDSGLQVNHRYGYRARARDNATTRNYTTYSSVLYAYTLANLPEAPSISSPTVDSLDVTINPDGNPSWTECAIWIYPTGGGAGHYLNSAGGSNGVTPVWRTAAAWGTVTASGLTPDTEYSVVVRARNGDGIQTSFGPAGTGRTRPICPAPAAPVLPSPADGAADVPVSTVLSWTDGGDCVVDQYQPLGPSTIALFSQTGLAQSFQPAADSMGGAGILLRPGVGTTDNVIISLWDDLPNAGGVMLATGSALGTQGTWVDVTWPSVGDTPGVTYYLVFTGNTTLGISGANNPYAYGQVYANPGYQPFPAYDYAFRTWTCGGAAAAAAEPAGDTSDTSPLPMLDTSAAPSVDVPEGFTIVDGELVEGEAVERTAAAPALQPRSALSQAMSGSVTVIDFDDVTAPCLFSNTVRLTTEYADLNAVFAGPGGNDGGAVLNECGGFAVSGHSSPNFLAFSRGATLGDGGVPQEPETITFARPVSQVEALVGSASYAGSLLTMRAYDSGNVLVDEASIALASTLAPIGVSAAEISKVVISTPANTFVVDDLTFDCPRTYDVYLGTNPAAMGLVCADLPAPPCDPPGTLAPAMTYYWQVIAKDCCGESAGPIWSFTTGTVRVLTATEPAANSSLPKTMNNLILCVFDGPITLPAAGNPLAIKDMTNGCADVSANFIYSIDADDPTGKTLEARENGDLLPDMTWYQVNSAPGWTDVAPFQFEVYTLVGDCTPSARVTTADYSCVKAGLGQRGDVRADLNGSGRVTTADYSVVKANLGHRAPAKPGLCP